MYIQKIVVRDKWGQRLSIYRNGLYKDGFYVTNELSVSMVDFPITNVNQCIDVLKSLGVTGSISKKLLNKIKY